MQRLRPFSCNETIRHGDRWLRPAETNRRGIFASRNASRGRGTPADGCHVSCDPKVNKAGQEGIVSRPDRLNIIHAVFFKRTGDQITERASRSRRSLLTEKMGGWDSEEWQHGLRNGRGRSRASPGIRCSASRIADRRMTLTGCRPTDLLTRLIQK
jgi:hypothetical protein